MVSAARPGAHQHRTLDKKPLPYGIRLIPHLRADAGYFTCLSSATTGRIVNLMPSANA